MDLYGHYKYLFSYSAGIDIRRQNLTSTDVDVYRRQILTFTVDSRTIGAISSHEFLFNILCMNILSNILSKHWCGKCEKTLSIISRRVENVTENEGRINHDHHHVSTRHNNRGQVNNI